MHDNGDQPYQSTQPGQYPQTPQYQHPQYPQPYQPPTPPYSGFAIASFVLGLVSSLTWMLFIPAILAIVFGILGLRDTGRLQVCAVSGWP